MIFCALCLKKLGLHSIKAGLYLVHADCLLKYRRDKAISHKKSPQSEPVRFQPYGETR